MKITKLKFETDFPIDFFLALNTCPQEKDGRYEWQSILPKSGDLKSTVV